MNVDSLAGYNLRQRQSSQGEHLRQGVFSAHRTGKWKGVGAGAPEACSVHPLTGVCAVVSKLTAGGDGGHQLQS